MKNLWDIQSILYVLLYSALIAYQWWYGFNWLLFGLALLIMIGLQVVHHNHVHLGVWHNKSLNRISNHFISVLTGIPSAMMFGGHIRNHHQHSHGPKDVTRTYRFGGDHNHGLGYLLHPFQAFGVLIPMFLRDFFHEWPKRTRFSRDLLLESVLIGAFWIVLCVIDWQKFFLFIWLPQAWGLHWLLAANYLQHAHCDDQSKAHYARNFIGVMNYFLLNIGFHTAHHDYPKMHWSKLRQLHQNEYQHLDSRLCQRSLLGYFTATFWASIFVPAYRSQTLRTKLESDIGTSEAGGE